MTDAAHDAPAAPAEGPTADGPVGIGGWLILPIIGLALTIVLTAVNLAVNVPAFTPDVVAELFATRPALLAFALASLLMGAGVLAFAAWNLVLMFRRSARLPGAMQVFYGVLVAVAVIEAVGMAGYPLVYSDADRGQAIRDVVRSVISAAIWIPYFRVSKRVRNTFVDPDGERRRVGEVFE